MFYELWLLYAVVGAVAVSSVSEYCWRRHERKLRIRRRLNGGPRNGMAIEYRRGRWLRRQLDYDWQQDIRRRLNGLH